MRGGEGGVAQETIAPDRNRRVSLGVVFEKRKGTERREKDANDFLGLTEFFSPTTGESITRPARRFCIAAPVLSTVARYLLFFSCCFFPGRRSCREESRRNHALLKVSFVLILFNGFVLKIFFFNRSVHTLQ